jgi:hypothetical protein
MDPTSNYQTTNIYHPQEITEIPPGEFKRNYYKGKITIGTCQTGSTKDINQSITTDSNGECITVFAIEKNGECNTAIMGWHFDDLTNQERIQNDFRKYVTPDKTYDLYLVGGDRSSVYPHDDGKCLLTNIQEVVERVFGKNKIRYELIYPKVNEKFVYTSANLGMDGKIVYCCHKP